MVNCDLGQACPHPEDATDVPSARKARVECQRTIDQGHHRPNVLAEPSERESRVRKNARVIAGHLQGTSRPVGALPTFRLRIFAPIVSDEPKMADGSISESRPVPRIALDGLFEQPERLRELRPRRYGHRVGAQLEVVGSEVGGRTAGRTGGFGGLQRRLDDACNARGDFVLKVEDVFERAVEAVRPQMRPGVRID